MQKRRLYLGLLLLAVAVVVGLLVAGALREREPEYGGKRLSEWVEEIGPGPQFVGSYEPWVIPSETDQAIHHIGTEAIPYLLKWIRYETPAWKTKFYKAVNRIIIPLKSSWQFTDKKQVRRAIGAGAALQALGPDADGIVVAELTKLLNDPTMQAGSRRASFALGRFGNAGLPPLLAALTNRQATVVRRDLLAFGIGLLGTNGRPAVPALQALLNDPDWTLRREATNALREINPHALEEAGQKIE